MYEIVTRRGRSAGLPAYACRREAAAVAEALTATGRTVYFARRMGDS